MNELDIDLVSEMRKLLFFSGGLIDFSFSSIGRLGSFRVFFTEQKILSLLFDVFLSVFNKVLKLKF